MDFHADDDFPLAGCSLDQLGGTIFVGAHAALHHCAGLALKPAAVSMARAARRIVASSNALPMNCRPRGKPFAVKPAGTEIPGKPARFTVTVKTSFKYIETGSAVFSPTPKAGPGV